MRTRMYEIVPKVITINIYLTISNTNQKNMKIVTTLQVETKHNSLIIKKNTHRKLFIAMFRTSQCERILLSEFYCES